MPSSMVQQPVSIELLSLSSTVETLLKSNGELKTIQYMAPQFQQNSLISKLLQDLKGKKGKAQKNTGNSDTKFDAFSKKGHF